MKPICPPIALVWIVTLTACGPSLGVQGALTDGEEELVDRWLFCEEECDEGRDPIEQLEDRAVPALARALRGLTAEQEANLRAQFAEAYRRSGLTTAQITEDEYIDFFMANVEARVQTQAAISLGDIDTNESREELRAALDDQANRGYREDVVRAIGRSFAFTSSEYPGFIGGITVEASFLDTVVVPEGGEDMSGDETITLVGGPFPDDVLVAPGPDAISFLAVGKSGGYGVVIGRLGPGDNLDRSIELVVESFDYTPHTPSNALNLSQGRESQRHFLALGDGVPRERYRIEPDSPQDVTATLDWRGDGQLVALARDCGFYTLPTANVVWGSVVDHLGDPLAGAQVTVDGTVLGAVTGPLGHFRITGVAGPSVSVTASAAGHRASTRPVQVGASEAVFALLPAGEPSFAPLNPKARNISVGPGACRFLEIVKVDRGTEPVIARLRLNVPDRVGPAIVYAPPPDQTTAATSLLIAIDGAVTDNATPIATATLDIRVDGTNASGVGRDGNCDPAVDYLLDPTANEIDKNSVDLGSGALSIPFSETFTIRSAGSGSVVTYCIVAELEDSALATDGSAAPNRTEDIGEFTITW